MRMSSLLPSSIGTICDTQRLASSPSPTNPQRNSFPTAPATTAPNQSLDQYVAFAATGVGSCVLV
eukprot:1402539-Rhodomonas_salina.6